MLEFHKQPATNMMFVAHQFNNPLSFSVLLLSVSLILLIAEKAQAECPQEDLIKPCSCSHIDFRCDKPNLNSARLAEIFRVKTIGRKAIRQLYIHSTNLNEIKTKQFGDFRIGRIYLDHNRIKTVETNAFANSHETISDLSLSANGLEKFPWNDLKFMRKLDRLFLLNNTLDVNPLKKLESKSLKELNLALNQLSTPNITGRIFEKLTNLEVLNLKANSIVSLPSEILFIDSRNKVVVSKLTL